MRLPVGILDDALERQPAHRFWFGETELEQHTSLRSRRRQVAPGRGHTRDRRFRPLAAPQRGEEDEKQRCKPVLHEFLVLRSSCLVRTWSLVPGPLHPLPHLPEGPRTRDWDCALRYLSARNRLSADDRMIRRNRSG